MSTGVLFVLFVNKVTGGVGFATNSHTNTLSYDMSRLKSTEKFIVTFYTIFHVRLIGKRKGFLSQKTTLGLGTLFSLTLPREISLARTNPCIFVPTFTNFPDYFRCRTWDEGTDNSSEEFPHKVVTLAVRIIHCSTVYDRLLGVVYFPFLL